LSVSEEIGLAAENAENRHRRQPHCCLMPLPINPVNIRILWLYLHSYFSGGLRKTHLFYKSDVSAIQVIQGHWFWRQSKARMRLPSSPP